MKTVLYCSLLLSSYLNIVIALDTINYVAFNVGNADIRYTKAKNKLVDPQVALNIQKWFDQIQPDVLMISELCKEEQLFDNVNCPGTDLKSGPLLDGQQYNSACTPLENGNHECVIWKKSKFLSMKSQYLIYPIPCHNDFSSVGAILHFNGKNITAIAVHPPSLLSTILTDCKEITNIALTWQFALSFNSSTVIGGDWNSIYRTVNNFRPSNFTPHIYEDCHIFWPFGGCLDSTFVTNDIQLDSKKEWRAFDGCDHYALVGTIAV